MNSSSPVHIGVLGAAAIVPNALTQPARTTPLVPPIFAKRDSVSAENESIRKWGDERGAEVVAIAARDRKRADAFARKHHIPRVHQTYNDLLHDPDIDA